MLVAACISRWLCMRACVRVCACVCACVCVCSNCTNSEQVGVDIVDFSSVPSIAISPAQENSLHTGGQKPPKHLHAHYYRHNTLTNKCIYVHTYVLGLLTR